MQGPYLSPKRGSCIGTEDEGNGFFGCAFQQVECVARRNLMTITKVVQRTPKTKCLVAGLQFRLSKTSEFGVRHDVDGRTG